MLAGMERGSALQRGGRRRGLDAGGRSRRWSASRAEGSTCGAPAVPGDVRRTKADSRDPAELGWEPRAALENGFAGQWAGPPLESAPDDGPRSYSTQSRRSTSDAWRAVAHALVAARRGPHHRRRLGYSLRSAEPRSTGRRRSSRSARRSRRVAPLAGLAANPRFTRDHPLRGGASQAAHEGGLRVSALRGKVAARTVSSGLAARAQGAAAHGRFGQGERPAQGRACGERPGRDRDQPHRAVRPGPDPHLPEPTPDSGRSARVDPEANQRAPAAGLRQRLARARPARPREHLDNAEQRRGHAARLPVHYPAATRAGRERRERRR